MMTREALFSPRDQVMVDKIRAREAAMASGEPRKRPQLLAAPKALDDEGVDAPADPDMVPEVDGEDAVPELLLYGVIGGWFGIWAEDVAYALKQLDGPSKVRVRIDSPGGSVFDGIAIYNLLRKFDAEIEVQVDSMAASIASVIAQAGDRIVMNRGSEMMIHSAWAAFAGNADEFREEADFLDRQTVKVARIYAAEAGGSEDHWLGLMRAKPDGTWFLADEAVEAGLADVTEDSGSGDAQASARRWALGAVVPPDPGSHPPAAHGGPFAGAVAAAMGRLSVAEIRAMEDDNEISTDGAPEAAPADTAADEAAVREAAARQRRRAVDIARAKLALASTTT